MASTFTIAKDEAITIPIMKQATRFPTVFIIIKYGFLRRFISFDIFFSNSAEKKWSSCSVGTIFSYSEVNASNIACLNTSFCIVFTSFQNSF